MSIVITRGILLRAYAYGDTSRILRFLTPDLGLAGLVARGVRNEGSKGRTTLDTFSEGTLTLYHRPGRDLQNFKDFHVSRSRRGLAGDLLRFSGASLVGEIVVRHAGEEANPTLYESLNRGLDSLEEASSHELASVILTRGWELVTVLGYRPELEHCVSCGRALAEEEMGRFDFSAGGVRCSSCAGADDGPRVGPGARRQLRSMVQARVPDDVGLPRAHLRLLGDFVTYHLAAGGPLKSLAILESQLPRADEGSEIPGKLSENGREEA